MLRHLRSTLRLARNELGEIQAATLRGGILNPVEGCLFYTIKYTNTKKSNILQQQAPPNDS
jgi:hypothetical protein